MSNLEVIKMINPFHDITSYLMALVIIHKMYCYKTNNIQIIHNCFARFINQCNIKQSETFINFITQYKNQYQHPFTFLINLKSFKSQVNYYCIQNNLASSIIEIDVDKCVFCKIENPYWFNYNSPKFSKKAVLYRIDGIGKINFKYLIIFLS